MNRTKSECKHEPNPVLKANLLSKFTYWWVRNLFIKGYNRPLKEEEIYENKPWLESETNTMTLQRLWNEELKSKNPSMLRAIWRAYGWRTITLGILICIADTCARVLQPLCLGGLVSYFVPGQKEITKDVAYLFACGIVLGSFIPVITFHPYVLYMFQIATKIRVGCGGLIYNKILRISKASCNDGLSGRAINILSNDLGKIDISLVFIHDLWKGPMEALAMGYLMYMEVGISAVIGMAFMLSFIPLQAWAAKKAAYYRQRTAERTDLRVKLMNEIIQGIQVIKMYAWEKSFAKVIAFARRKEINAIRGTVYIHAGLYTTTMISRFSIFISLVSYVYLGDAITTKKVYVVSSFFNMLNDSMVHFWPLAITFCAEAYVSLRRVKEFLLEKEGKDHPVAIAPQMSKEGVNGHLEKSSNGIVKIQEKTNEDPLNSVKIIGKRRIMNLDSDRKGIIISSATAAWDSSTGEKSNDVIKDFNIEVKDSSLVVVVGPVGAGKSSLLNVIIGELELDNGYVTVNGVPSYACQEPWVFEGTIKDNIVFIDDFDETRYNEVVRVCALERDLELFPNGDQTLVGERGISLSGGQKARVSLARAIYKKADIYLLDDPLSAVDAQVGRHIFEKCIKEFLKTKICVLVTHQLQYLKDVEHVIFINNGTIAAQGNYNDLQKLPDMNFLAAMHDESGETEEMEKIDKEFQKITKPISKKAVQDDIDERKETQAVGAVSFQVYKSYFKSLETYWFMFIVFFLFIAARATLAGVDYFISRWAIWEEEVGNATQSTLQTAYNETTSEILIRELLSATGQNNVSRVIDPEIQSERENLMIIYSILLGSALILYLGRTYGFFMMCLRISLNLHDKLFRGITRAKMRFFNTNPSGRILNRFARDMHTVDTAIPDSLLDCLYFVTDVSAVLIMVVIVNYWLLLPVFIVSIIFYIFRNVYVNTARSVKRIESMSRSPVYSHTNQTFQGITTIRAFQAEEILKAEFHSFQNTNSGYWYIFLAITRAFAFWLDMVCVIFIGTVTFSFLLLEDNFLSGDVGLAIMQCVAMLGMVQWGMRQSAELENQMTSVERISEYADQPSEGAFETAPEHKPKDNWPENGTLKFDKLSLKYSENGDPILKNLSFQIAPMEKIGIVGRTGAGKSSIIQAVFRLALNEGLIEIDGSDVGKLGLHDLRSNISIIPQDAILFSGTLRYNLDPFETKKDEELWKALEDVELKPHVSSLVGGLNCKMSDGGSNFSMGQRQLVCLARAILRNNKILILDEATANVDPETDKLIQRTIRTKFAKCTVLTIAHRLHTVMDSDRVIVMDAGQAVEFGHPYELLKKPDGHLRNLVNKTGSATAAILMDAAKTSFHSSSSNSSDKTKSNVGDPH